MILDTHGSFKGIVLGSKKAKIVGITVAAVGYLAFFIASIVHFLHSSNIGVGIALILMPFVLNAICLIPIIDMARAYVEVKDDTITVVDYYFFIKAERVYKMSDICKGKIVQGHGSFTSGYGLGVYDSKYVEFENEKGEYLFKVLVTNDVKSAFGDKAPTLPKFGFKF